MLYPNNKILIVDDEKYYRFMLRTLLEKKLHVQTIDVPDFFQGVPILNKTKIDLILLDMQMPKINGYESLKKIRSTESLKNMPVICFSAVNDAMVIKGLIKLGISNYVLKSSEPLMIIDRVGKVLEHVENNDEEESFRMVL